MNCADRRASGSYRNHSDDRTGHYNHFRRRPEPLRRRPEPLRRLPEPLRRLPESLRRLPEPLRRRPEPLRRLPEPFRRLPEPFRRLPEPFRRPPEPFRRRPEPLGQVTEPFGQRRRSGARLTNCVSWPARTHVHSSSDQREHFGGATFHVPLAPHAIIRPDVPAFGAMPSRSVGMLGTICDAEFSDANSPCRASQTETRMATPLRGETMAPSLSFAPNSPF